MSAANVWHRLGADPRWQGLRTRLAPVAGSAHHHLSAWTSRLRARWPAMPPAANARFAPLAARASAWCEQFDARVPRERILLIGAAVVVVAAAADALWLTPALKDWTRARQERQQAQAALQSLRDSVAELQTRGAQERQQLEAELRALRERHGAQMSAAKAAPAAPTAKARPRAATPDTRHGAGGLVAANEMLPLLGKLMRSHPGLKVRSLNSLGHLALGAAGQRPTAGAAGAGPVATAASGVAGKTPPLLQTQNPTIYRHGVELTLEGSYADLVAYLQAVEALPQRLLWGSLQLRVDEYPRVLMTVRLYTLSLDARWLEI